jgi:predicted ABC-class ATPase
MGANTLLIDEDTCATNFMIRDSKMIQLVASDKEPITPFVRVVESLRDQGISTVLVVGGTGDFFAVADHVLVMDCYRCDDATSRAHQIVQDSPLTHSVCTFHHLRARYLVPNNFVPDGRVKVSTKNNATYGTTEIDLHAVEQIISKGQTEAIVESLRTLASSNSSCRLREALEDIDCKIDSDGLNSLSPGEMNGSLMRPRMLEISAAANRLRRECVMQG